MTIAIANTANTNLVSYWRARTNDIAYAMSTYTVTTDSNTTIGNATISGSYIGNTLIAKTLRGGNATSSEALNVTSNVFFSGVRTNLGPGANVVITTGNSTHRVMMVNTANGSTLFGGRINLSDVNQLTGVSGMANNDLLIFVAASNTFVPYSFSNLVSDHTHSFSSITSKPTTLAGYGISVPSIGNSTVNTYFTNSFIGTHNTINVKTTIEPGIMSLAGTNTSIYILSEDLSPGIYISSANLSSIVKADSIEVRDYNNSNSSIITPATVSLVNGIDSISLDPSGVTVSSATTNTSITFIAPPTVNAAANDSHFISGSGNYVKIKGKQSIWVPANDMIPRLTAGPTMATAEMSSSKTIYETLNFNPSSLSTANFVLKMPKRWDGGDISFRYVWYHETTTVDFSVVFLLRAASIINLDLDYSIPGAGVSISTGGTEKTGYVSPESSSFAVQRLASSSDPLLFGLVRSTSNASDTLDVDAKLIGIEIFYNNSAFTDD